MQRVAHDISDLKGGVAVMHSAVVNNNVCFESKEVFDSGNLDKYIGLEEVSYIVIEAGSQSITSGLTPYSLQIKIEGNYAFYPKVSDPFAM
jgi:hypothetical protein